MKVYSESNLLCELNINYFYLCLYFIVVNKYYNENKYRNALMRIDCPKALEEQQKELERKQSIERRRERLDEEVCI